MNESNTTDIILEMLNENLKPSLEPVLNLSLTDNILMYPPLCPYYDLLEFLNKYYTPFIIIIGLVGNFLSCIVFLTTHLKMKSSSYYLAALSMADFGFLSMLLIVYLSNNSILEFDLYNRFGWCQIIVYISSVCALLSVWLIVAFTVERFIAVQYPLQRPHICTVSRAKGIILGIVIVALLSQTYTFKTAGIIVHEDKEIHTINAQCELIDEHFLVMQVINIIDTIFSLIGPFILIVAMNTMIARNLFVFQKKFQHNSVENSLSSEKSDINLQQTQFTGMSRNSIRIVSQNSQNSTYKIHGQSSRRSKNSENFSGCIHSGRHFLSTRNQQSITKMLLLVSSVFILFNLPSYVIRMYVFFVFSLWEQPQPAKLWCLQQLFMLLYYTNFSINFLLYAMCGITFRRCLWKMIRNNLKRLTKSCSIN